MSGQCEKRYGYGPVIAALLFMKPARTAHYGMLLAVFLLLSGCEDAVTVEVTGNQTSVFSPFDGKDMTRGEVLVKPVHGNVLFDFRNDRISYVPDSGFYGLDYVSLKAGLRKCFLFTCWTDWQPVKANIQVGPGPSAGLRDIVATKKVKRIGAGGLSEPSLRQSAAYRSNLAREFNTITLGLYWSVVSSQPGIYDFSAPDFVASVAKANGMAIKGHNLVWYMAIPDYVVAAEGKPALMRQITEDHIRTVMGHYDTVCTQPTEKFCIKDWDVVNEPSASKSFMENPATGVDGRYRNTPHFKTFGASYIDEAFRAARRAAPSATLWINEYNVESASIKSDNFYSILKEKINSGVPIDGVGFQAHVWIDHSPIELLNNMRRYSALGLKLNLSEMDVPAPALAGAINHFTNIIVVQKRAPVFFEVLAVPAIGRTEIDQKIYYENYATACDMVPNCDWITQWGMTDGESWMHPYARALTFTDGFQRKPTYFALAQGLTQNGVLREPENKTGIPFDLGAMTGTVVEAVLRWRL